MFLFEKRVSSHAVGSRLMATLKQPTDPASGGIDIKHLVSKLGMRD
ncbi:MAG: hypothetical protein ACE5H1_06885 [Thermodesulfobacteriota bacterium]